MKKQEILKHLSDQVLEVINYLEEHCDYEQLFEDGLYAMLYIRYQNALSLLREKSPGYSRLQAGLQFLISANRAYVGASSDWEDPLRKLLSEADRLVDQYLHDDKKEENSPLLFSFGKLFWGDIQKGAGKTCSFLRFEVCFLRKVEFIPKRCGCVYWVQSYYTHPGRRSVVFE